MAPRRPLASILAVMLLALLAATALGDSSSSTTTTTVSNSTSESYCESCRDSGHCSQAYRGSPGVYCGAWLSAASQRLACCCPTGQCAKTQSNYECLCSSASTSKPSSSSSSTSTAASSEHKKYVFIAVGVFVVAFIAMATLCYCHRQNNARYSDHDETYIVEQPTVYVQAAPPAYAPQYASQPVGYASHPMGYAAQPSGYAVHHLYDDRRGGGDYSGAIVAAGAAAGFLGGMIVGDMIADAGDNGDGNTYNDYGGGGGDDSGMFAGDF